MSKKQRYSRRESKRKAQAEEVARYLETLLETDHPAQSPGTTDTKEIRGND
jgi:hypothetical protein